MLKYTKWDDVPDHLKTKTSLGKLGLKPAPEQEPAAVKTSTYYKTPDYDLYDMSQAVEKRKMSEAQQEALTKARTKAMTTTCCNRYVGRVNWKYKRGMCHRCHYEWEFNQHMLFLNSEKQAAIEWAAGVLVDKGVIILDTETTGLEGEIIELSIIDTSGNVLFDSLIRPIEPIPADATRIHGITNEDVIDAPTWLEAWPVISCLLKSASRVVIYNADFDIARMAFSCVLSDLNWSKEFQAQCAMEEYARWYGEYSDHHGSFRWQRLNGGHRALGDCQATLEKIKAMTNEPG